MTLFFPTARDLYLYLRDIMVPFYERKGRGEDLCKISSGNMIENTIQGAQKVAVLEEPELLRILKKKRHEPTVRSSCVNSLKHRTLNATSTRRLLNHQDPLVGTVSQTMNSERAKRLTAYAWIHGVPEDFRMVASLMMCCACCLRHITLELLTYSNLFLDFLGDPHFAHFGQKIYSMLAICIDKSKENLIGHKQISGCIHALDIENCPIVLMSVWFYIKFVVWKQHYCDFDSDEWMNTPLMQTRGKIHLADKMSDTDVRKDYHRMYKQALPDLTDEMLKSLPLRHAGRRLCVMWMNNGGVCLSLLDFCARVPVPAWCVTLCANVIF
jgi:hypothetical protein